MKRILILMLAVAIMFASHGLASASIANSKHDMYGGPVQYGTDPNVCSYCHTPHNAQGTKIWSDWGNEAEITSGPSSTIGNLCYTCHDGFVTSLGATTVFNASLQQHKVGGSDDCNLCHTVHDNSNLKFLGVVASGGGGTTESATYCETCHSVSISGGAVALGDHLAGAEHPYSDAGALLDDSCNSCHIVHGAANYTTGSLTNPILKVDNTDSAYCAVCHAGKQQTTSGGDKHPANLASAGTWGKSICQDCHDVHQPTATDGRVFVLNEKNDYSSYCTTCHETSSETNGPKIGSNSHPIAVAYTTTGVCPDAAAIDDDDDGADYPYNTNQEIVCESCHSIHGKGVASPLLRITKASGALCINCHDDK